MMIPGNTAKGMEWSMTILISLLAPERMVTAIAFFESVPG
jgi:hypothetical protein